MAPFNVAYDQRPSVDEVLAAGLAALPSVERQAVILAYFEHESRERIAERLAIPVPAVNSTVARALRTLARFLEQPT
jgi:DNA-directed RNA polymerase specialized sigma24 family protein